MKDDDKYKINSDLFPHFEKLKNYFNEYSNAIATDNQNLFDEITKATIIKSFEFNLYVTGNKDDQVFFMIPTLRGICEEYIAEKFIFNHFATDKSAIIYLWTEYHRLKSSIAQWEYFKISKPSQFLYYEENFPDQLKETEKKIKEIFQKKFPKTKATPFPSIYFMAEKSELIELYNYLYHVTSTFVHFHPGNLLRMGWGNLPHFQFSTAHFVKYYNYFTVFYGAVLFCNLCEWQTKNGYLKNFNTDSIKIIREILFNVSRHPEIVTFDEMNIGALSRHLFYTSPELSVKKKNKPSTE
jgi:hypothetical protein